MSAEAEIVNKKASEAKAIADDAESDLAAAKPELAAAQNAVKNLDKNAIIEYLNNSYSKAKFPKEKEALKRLLTEFSYDKDNDVHITTVNYACDKNFSEYEDLLISIQTPNFRSQPYSKTPRTSSYVT